MVITALSKLKRKLAGPLQELVTFPALGGWGRGLAAALPQEARAGIRSAGQLVREVQEGGTQASPGLFTWRGTVLE